MKKTVVWDLPTRVFHWSLVVLLCISFYTGTVGGFEIMDYHMLSGFAILGLILFRILWGFFGNRNARFLGFVRGPGTIIAYLRGQHDHQAGHNPLGALSVLAMLVAVLVQAVTGLFANDDIMLEGPLVHLVSYDMSRQLTGIHEINRWVIVGLAGLHVLAVLFYQFIRKESVILPMITGRKDLADNVPDAHGNWLLAIVAAAISAGLVYYVTNYL